MATNRASTPEAEDDLLSSIPGFEPVDNGTGVEDEDTGTDNEETEGNPPEGKAEEESDPSLAQGGEEDGEQTGKDGQQQQQQQNDEQVRYDKQGNVVDAKGNIIAPAGRYRRLDEQNRRLKAVAATNTKEIAALKGQLAQINFLNGAPQKYGLSNEEVAISLDMYNLFKNQPEQAVTMFLSEAAARGVDIGKILGNPGAIQTQAIQRMLDTRLAPIDKAERERAFQENVRQEAESRYNSFLAEYPDATIHQDAIAKLMNDGKARDEVVAYHMLRGFAAANGLNFEQPLGPQIQTKLNARQQRQPQSQQRQLQKPMPNGRQINRQAAPRNVAVASPDRSFSSIVDEAMREAGINS